MVNNENGSGLFAGVEMTVPRLGNVRLGFCLRGRVNNAVFQIQPILLRIKLILLLSIIFSFSGNACSCIGGETLSEQYLAADLIIFGKVVSKRIVVLSDTIDGDYVDVTRAAYKVVVKKTYKGVNQSDTIEVVTQLGFSGDCGVRFQINRNYVIYMYKHNKYFNRGKIVPFYFSTDICTRTTGYKIRKEIRLIKRYIRKSKKYGTTDSMTYQINKAP